METLFCTHHVILWYCSEVTIVGLSSLCLYNEECGCYGTWKCARVIKVMFCECTIIYC